MPPIALEAYRISGEKNITPDLATKRVIAAAGNPRLSASFKLCITAFGTISGVALLKPSGSMAYDRTLERQIYDWKYRPFMLDGKPTPVCTAVTFIYSQASRRVR